MSTSALSETFEINARIVRYVLAAVPAGALPDRGATRGRSAGEMFAHIHNVRLMWLQSAAPAAMAGLSKIEKDAAHDAAVLDRALAASQAAVAAMLDEAAITGRVRGFKPHAQAFVGYLVAHEFYHLGEIGVALQQGGHALDRKTAFGMWEWGSR